MPRYRVTIKEGVIDTDADGVVDWLRRLGEARVLLVDVSMLPLASANATAKTPAAADAPAARGPTRCKCPFCTRTFATLHGLEVHVHRQAKQHADHRPGGVSEPVAVG